MANESERRVQNEDDKLLLVWERAIQTQMHFAELQMLDATNDPRTLQFETLDGKSCNLLRKVISDLWPRFIQL
jgi:hypothetical protein